MNAKSRRIAINVGARFVPGMNSVLTGVTLAAAELGWEVVGIRNGFAGLHEVLSGTRVRALRRRTKLAVPYLDLQITTPRPVAGSERRLVFAAGVICRSGRKPRSGREIRRFLIRIRKWARRTRRQHDALQRLHWICQRRKTSA